ncbi:MAG: hypothetical protein RL122_457 [Pseudomonadota bacterium]|jgi:hypothetical protein|uniref:DUF4878 domain-containing protein n=1 Tax=Thiothrix fructosivorans TaxID=111770 RepID=A0A8B0SIV1_9GAMM|nr:hypothetical protein [Thiothrix fructosivorans]MBO0613297.1 hypothetical protein [Thiothrix fructosivorans]QTX11266.1 hypothetical protein J1836_002570 [Thiothrix fructosivorans]
MNAKRWLLGVYLLVMSMCLSGCIFSSESQQAREVTNTFWQAVLNADMETAKDLTTWESAQYLQFLSSKSLAAKRFETGEIKIDGTTAEVATLLYGGEKGDMEIPVRTILIRNKDAWQVDVQKTLGSMVSGAMDAVVDQLNIFMENGLKDLDRALADSVNELNQSLKQGVDQLKKDLATPPTAPLAPASPPPSSGSVI